MSFVYVHIERAHLVDLSFQDTAILMKNGEKNENLGFYSFVYWEVWSISWPRDIFDSAIFSRDILQNVKNEKGPTLSILMAKIRKFERAHFVDTWLKSI